jgi:hypothetical protein
MSDEIIEPRKRSLPEHAAKIQSLVGDLSDDRRKVRVTVELSREDTKPDLELRLLDAEDIEVSHTTIIEAFGPSMSFTMHLRKEKVKFPLTLTCQMSYLDDVVESEKKVVIAIE